MTFIQCKNETEKLDAIKRYCKVQIMENNRNIQWLEANKSSPLDYADEIHELKLINKRFAKILEIIEADEFTNVMIL